MACHLYYDHGVSAVSDHEYELMVAHVVRNYDCLHGTRAWQLGGRKQIEHTGMRVKLTTLTISASHDWYTIKTGRKLCDVLMNKQYNYTCSRHHYCSRNFGSVYHIQG